MRGEGGALVEVRGRDVVRTCQRGCEGWERERNSLLVEKNAQVSVGDSGDLMKPSCHS